MTRERDEFFTAQASRASTSLHAALRAPDFEQLPEDDRRSFVDLALRLDDLATKLHHVAAAKPYTPPQEV